MYAPEGPPRHNVGIISNNAVNVLLEVRDMPPKPLYVLHQASPPDWATKCEIGFIDHIRQCQLIDKR